MKLYLHIVGMILLIIMLIACKEPSPTQLNSNLQDGSNITLEVIAENPGVYVYANGYDTTGIVEPVLDKSTVISISGIRYTNYGNRKYDDYYLAQFNDKGNPVYNKNNNLLGFMGVNKGDVHFNNTIAMVMPNDVSFHNSANDPNVKQDTMMGTKYIYSTKLVNKTAPVNFPYNSSVSFLLNQNSSQNHGGGSPSVLLNIPTPKEIIGTVSIQGNSSQNNVKIALTWNGLNSGQIDIVIGEYGSSSSVFPLFKLTGDDNGRMSLPQSIIDKLIQANSKELLITFIRKKIKEEVDNTLNDNYIVAQSIHNIKIQVP